MRSKFFYSCRIKICILGFSELLEGIFCLCWLWKHFPCRKLSRCLKKWQSVSGKSGEYGGWGKTFSPVCSTFETLVVWRGVGHYSRRNGSLLLGRIRENNTSKQWFFWFSVTSWGTQLLNFFTFPVCLKCQMTAGWSMLGSSATSHVVLRGSASLFALSRSLSTFNGQLLHSSSSSLLLKLLNLSAFKTSWTITALYVRYQFLGHMRCWCCLSSSPLLYNPFWTWIRKLLNLLFV